MQVLVIFTFSWKHFCLIASQIIKNQLDHDIMYADFIEKSVCVKLLFVWFREINERISIS